MYFVSIYFNQSGNKIIYFQNLNTYYKPHDCMDIHDKINIIPINDIYIVIFFPVINEYIL